MYIHQTNHSHTHLRPREPSNIHNRQLHLVVPPARRQNPTAHDEQLLLMMQDAKVTSIRLLLRRRHPDPRRTGLAKTPVDVDIAAGSTADNDGAVLPAHRTPHVVRRALRNHAVGGDQRNIRSRVELLGVGRETVGDGEVVPVCEARAATELVGDQVLAVGQLGDGRHARAHPVLRVCDVVDDGAPGEAVGGGLVDQLLAVGGVLALV
jgi:hypothetical protein